MSATTVIAPESAAAVQLLPAVVPAGTGAVADCGDHRMRVLMSAQQTGGTFSLLDVNADHGSGVPPHFHRLEDETFYIQEGRFEFMAGGKIIEAGPGDTVFGPRNVPHAWRCTSQEGGRFTLLLSPGANFENFARTMGEHDIFPITPDTLPRLLELTEKHGITMLPPQG